LNYSITSIAEPESQQKQPPLKRAKLSEPIPDTIRERLAAKTYTSFNAFLSDVSAVCRALKATLSATPKANDAPTGWENANTVTARVIHFESFTKDLINRERKRMAYELDFTEEVDHSERQESKKSEKVALSAMTLTGPVFSSLPTAETISVPSLVSSRSTTATGSPQSPASTAATDVSDWKPKTETISVVAPFAEPSISLPHISVVKGLGEEDSAPKETPRQTKLGEVFPPPPALLHHPEPRPDYSKYGVHWGGTYGPGGIARQDVYTGERVGEWLQYSNYPQPGLSRLPPDPYRQGIGLPATFVAAYSSFAPTRDDSHSKVPAAASNAQWWRQHGARTFRRMFSADPSIGHMFAEPTPPPPAAAPSNELDEKALESMIENLDELPIDTRLQMDKDAQLDEITQLLHTLSSQQYTRLATSSQSLDPTSEEVQTYQKLRDRLTELTAALPPHVLATIDGDVASPLNLSARIPITDPHNHPRPIYHGNLPGEVPTVQAAAMTAMNAAAGLSPIAAPVANMMPPHQQQVRGAPHLTVQQSYPHPPPAPPPSQQRSQQYQYTQQRPRGNVPPPQGLGAIGVGPGGGYQQVYGHAARTPAVATPGRRGGTR
jgi:hypothetical protein